MTGSQTISSVVKSAIIRECLNRKYFRRNVNNNNHRFTHNAKKELMRKFHGVSKRALTRIKHDYFYPPAPKIVKKKGMKRNRGRPSKIVPEVLKEMAKIGQFYARNYTLVTPKMMCDKLNENEIIIKGNKFTITYNTVYRYMKYTLQPKRHTVRFVWCESSHSRYDEIIARTLDADDPLDSYFSSNYFNVSRTSQPQILLWEGVDGPDQFYPTNYDDFEMNRDYVKRGGRNTFQHVPVVTLSTHIKEERMPSDIEFYESPTEVQYRHKPYLPTMRRQLRSEVVDLTDE